MTENGPTNRRPFVPALVGLAVAVPQIYYWSLVWATLTGFALVPPWELTCTYLPACGQSLWPWPTPGTHPCMLRALVAMTLPERVICTMARSGAFLPLLLGTSLAAFGAVHQRPRSGAAS